MPESITKTFVFEKVDTQQAIIVNHPIDQQLQNIDLNPLLRLHCPMSTYNIWMYHPERSEFNSVDKLGLQNGCFPRHLLQPSVILIRFIEKGAMVLESQSLKNTSCESSNQQKDSRYRERTIGQVIALIKKWRNLHLYEQGIMRKRLSLLQAAKVVGIPKKSLDDYYCQLRLGEQYNFDYISNLHQKMGTLRSHIKNSRPEKQQRGRRQNDKHPKNLKILEQFDLVTNNFKNQQKLINKVQRKIVESPQSSLRDPTPLKQMEGQENNSEQSGRPQNVAEVRQPGQTSPITKQLFEMENVFFKDFQMILGADADPYNEMDRDLRRQDVDLDSSGLMFFF